MAEGAILDNSELTLDLIHILELIDNQTNYGRILNMCSMLINKLDRFNEVISLLKGTDEPYSLEVAQGKLEAITKLAVHKRDLLERNRPKFKDHNSNDSNNSL